MSRCHCQVAGNVFPVGSSQGAASALQRPSCHIEVICCLQHRGSSAFPPTLLKKPPLTFISRAPVPSCARGGRVKSSHFHISTGTGPETRDSRREQTACYMASSSDGDMWSRVSQRQICAGVCHLKRPPQCVR